MSEENEKKSEDSIGKDAAEALFKSRSVFIYGEVTQENGPEGQRPTDCIGCYE